MKLKVAQDLSNIKDPEDLQRFLSNTTGQIVSALDGSLSLSDNLNGEFLNFSFVTSNTDTTVTHSLGRVPAGYIVTSNNSNKTIYDGSTNNTASYLVLRASGAGTASIYVF